MIIHQLHPAPGDVSCHSVFFLNPRYGLNRSTAAPSSVHGHDAGAAAAATRARLSEGARARDEEAKAKAALAQSSRKEYKTGRMTGQCGSLRAFFRFRFSLSIAAAIYALLPTSWAAQEDGPCMCPFLDQQSCSQVCPVHTAYNSCWRDSRSVRPDIPGCSVYSACSLRKMDDHRHHH